MNICKRLKEYGTFILMFLFIVLIFSCLMFFINISITRFNLIISFIITGILYYFLINKDKNILKNTVILSFIIILFSSILTMFVFDRSSDGNTYHKDAIGNLNDGWNPIYQDSHDFVKKQYKNINADMDSYDIWKDHYAKANWILEANFYKTFSSIEAGKAVNLLFMFILFSFSLLFFTKRIKSNTMSVFLALLLTFNPISCNQLWTFYNDQLVTSTLFIIIILLIEIVSSKKINKRYFIEYFMVFTILFNLKFNGLGYLLVFSFTFMIYYLFINYKGDKSKFFKFFGRLAIYFVILFITSICVVGYSTYIKNTIDHHNPFYPLYGDDTEDIITAQQPKSFVYKNNYEKLFIGLFSESNNLQTNRNYKLKIPFTVSKKEIKESMSVDTRLSGFGILFSGILVLSVVIIIIYLCKTKKSDEKNIIILILLNILVLSLLISEAWWARYNPQVYLISIIGLYILFKYNKFKYINYLIILLIIINNSLIILGNTYYSFKNSYTIYKDLSKLKNKEVKVSFNDMNVVGIYYNLNDFDIKYKVLDINSELNNTTYYKYLNYEEK